MTATWPPTGGYPDTVTNVYKATVTSYYFDNTSYRKPVLMRRESGSAPQVVAYNIDGFRVYYEMQDGKVLREFRIIDEIAILAQIHAGRMAKG